MRLSGTLRSWTDDRGFGFIAPTNGGAELFVHVSALPRDGSRPTVGEKITYELGRGPDGRPRAVDVRRGAVGAGQVRARGTRAEAASRGFPVFKVLVGLVLVMTVGAVAVNQYRKWPMAATPVDEPPSPVQGRRGARAGERIEIPLRWQNALQPDDLV